MPTTISNNGAAVRLSLAGLKPDSEIAINLNWNKRDDAGFLARLLGRDAIDLDLGCYFLLRNGKQTLIDGLQFAGGKGGPRSARTKQGCYDQEPFIWHAGDDKGSGDDSGETILVNPAGVKAIERIIVYAFIYDGSAHWRDTKAVVAINVPGCDQVQVPMGQEQSHKRFCAIAQIDFSDDGKWIDVTKLVTFHTSQSDCDAHYGWGFNYEAGDK